MLSLAAPVQQAAPVAAFMGFPGQGSSGFRLEVPNVLRAIESLYDDQLRPYGRILRKRLGEHAQLAGAGAVDVDIKQLRALCEACPWLSVQAEEGGDWSALLRTRPLSFIDVYSPTDLYPRELWRAASAYFESLDVEHMVLPGGRYSCAQVLLSRSLPLLRGRTLGQVCHIVQLAISQKKLLGYLNGAVVPYARSQSMIKERCAERQRPCTSAARGTSGVATWEMVRTCLQDLFRGMEPGACSMPLSNVKRLFRSRFHAELSETALGHAKLSEMLQDQRLRDICTVRLQGHGYVVLPAAQHAKCNPISLADKLPQHPAAVAPAAPPRRARRAPEPLCLDDGALQAPLAAHRGAAAVHTQRGGHAGGCEQDASLHSELHCKTPSPHCMPGARSLPVLLGNLRPEVHAAQQAAKKPSKVPQPPTAPPTTAPREAPEHMAQQAPLPSPTGPAPPEGPKSEAEPRPLLTPCTLENLGFSVQNTFIHVSMPPPTPPAGSSCRSSSLPRSMGSKKCFSQGPAHS
mmetsp:Transcript_7024/g.20711  ORF Transcript_7024/g.20711 Transcript_7024/m.20711 type:complete len:518 (-) Transcript_7024:447-2000(-)